MPSSEPKLNAKQELAATALARGVSVDDAAGEAGVHVRTVVRWRTDEAFNQAIAQYAIDSIIEERKQKRAQILAENPKPLKGHGANQHGDNDNNVQEISRQGKEPTHQKKSKGTCREPQRTTGERKRIQS